MGNITKRQKEIQRLEGLLELYKTNSTIEDLAKRYGVSVPAIWKWIRIYPDFPKKSERLLGRSALRNTEEVDKWLASKRITSRATFARGR